MAVIGFVIDAIRKRASSSQPSWNCRRSPATDVATASAGTCQRSIAC